MAGKESSNSTKLRHYGAFVLILRVCSFSFLLRGKRSRVYECEMKIDVTGRIARDKNSRRGDGGKCR